MRFFIPALPIALLLTAATGVVAPQRQRNLSRYSYSQIHMGVQVRLVVYAPNQAIAERACKAAFARVAELDQIMSDYRPDSELNRMWAKASCEAVPVSDDLFTILHQAQAIAQLSDGAFDVTVGPFVRLWRKARKAGQLPSGQELAAAKERVGWQKIRLNETDKTVQLHTSGMQLDLGGIAKGYAGDCALKSLRTHGVTRALFEAGGDIVVGAAPPGRPGWNIALFDDSKALTLSNCAVSTSGDTEQFVEFGGKRYSHIVDPRTGLGLTDRIAVTVVAKQGILSDALSTAISVLGEERGKLLAQQFAGTRVFVRTLEIQQRK